MSFRMRRILSVPAELQLLLNQNSSILSAGETKVSIDIKGSKRYLSFSSPNLCYRAEFFENMTRTIATDEGEEINDGSDYPVSVVLGISENFELEIKDKKNGKKLSEIQRRNFLYDWQEEVSEFLENSCEVLKTPRRFSQIWSWKL